MTSKNDLSPSTTSTRRAAAVKARNVVRRFSAAYGIETFAPVVKFDTIRIVLAVLR
jgi:hypothetical protein